MSFKEQILSRIYFPQGRLCLAFSGGSDSAALLSLLPSERSYAVYVDHNIRPRSELDAEIELNRKNAERYGVPFKVITLDENAVKLLSSSEKIGLEAAARKLRYDALLKEDADYILTAHHRDDQAETVIMRLLSSSPLYRLEGIRRENGKIYRPFLTVDKSLINSYIAEENIAYSTDSTNSDMRYKRNAIRRSILPRLTEDEKITISNIALNMQQVNAREKEIEVSTLFKCTFSRAEYLSASLYRREDALFNINSYLGASALLSRNEIERITAAIESSSGYSSPRFILKTAGDMVSAYPRHFNIVMDGSKDFSIPGLEYTVRDNPEDDKTLIIDFSSVKGKLIFRNSREGDSIVLKEGRKKLSVLEKEYKVPYFFILEDEEGIVALFARLFGARDRIARRFLGKKGKAVSLNERSLR